MGNKYSCCGYKTSKRKSREEVYQPTLKHGTQSEESSHQGMQQSYSSLPGVPHISDRENLPEGIHIIALYITVDNMSRSPAGL